MCARLNICVKNKYLKMSQRKINILDIITRVFISYTVEIISEYIYIRSSSVQAEHGTILTVR